MEVSLKELKPNESAIVKSIGGSGPVRRRLMDMGVTPGVKITLRKIAPLGDPVEISLRGYRLCLRKSETKYFELEIA